MARDVEFDALAHDKSAAGLASLERNFKRTNDRIKADGDRLGAGLGDGLVKGVGKVSPKLGTLIAEGMGSGARLGAPLIGAAVVGVAPVVSGLMSAAVLGGAGLGGIVGGALLAARDVRVKSAADDLGKTVMRSLDRNAGVFVKPLLASVDTVKDKFVELDPVIKSIFANSARYVEPLADAATDAIADIVKGADTAIAAAKPVMDSINNGIRGTGRVVRGFFEDMSADGEQSARNLDSAFETINTTLALTGDAVRIVNRTFAELDRIMPLSVLTTLNKLFGETEDGARRTSAGTFGAAEGIETAGDAASDASGDMRSLADQERDAANAATGLYGATTSAAEAIARSTKIIKENGKGLSTNSQKGRENRDALAGVANALNRQYDSYVAVNGAGAKADAVLVRNRASFVKLATAATGSATKANKLADALLGVKSRDVTVTAATAAAQAKVRALQAQIDSLRGKTVTVNVRYRGDGANENSPSIGGGGGRTFDAGDYWRAVDQAAANRSAPPTPVDVSSTVSVSLDGAPFRTMTAVAVRAERGRARWRQKYGGRS